MKKKFGIFSIETVVTCTPGNWPLHVVYQDLCLEQAVSLDITKTPDDNSL
jgi:hypothetical protein